jgi:hypothetical protein
MISALRTEVLWHDGGVSIASCSGALLVYQSSGMECEKSIILSNEEKIASGYI